MSLSPYGSVDPYNVGSLWGDIGGALSSAASAVSNVVNKVESNPILSAAASAVPGFTTIAKVITAADAAVNKKDMKPALTHLDDNTLTIVLRIVGMSDDTIAQVIKLRAAGML